MTTPEQKAAVEWTGENWTRGLKLAGADSNYVAFWAFLAGVEYANRISGERGNTKVGSPIKAGTHGPHAPA